jgi:hypothetical protein
LIGLPSVSRSILRASPLAPEAAAYFENSSAPRYWREMHHSTAWLEFVRLHCVLAPRDARD